MASPGLGVGDRIFIRGGHWGTVRYLGPVPGQTGDWAGVEWDEVSRGKHDGTAAGVRLFTCRRQGTPATLVRLVKLEASLMDMMSLEQALEQRYCRDDDGSGERVADNGGGPPAPLGGEVLVAGRQGLLAAAANLPSLAHASLSGMPVDLRDSPDDVAALVPALESLDLSGTGVRGWGQARHALSGLRRLCSLDLSSVALALQATDPGVAGAGLDALHTLVLNATGCGWDHACALAATLPALHTLCLCDNAIATVSAPGTRSDAPGPETGTGASAGAAGQGTGASGAARLRYLDLSGNRLSGWAQVWELGAQLPELNTLNLSGCPLGEGGAAGAFAATPCFPSLRTLLLAGCGVGSWAEVQALARLGQLSNLRLTGTPVWESAGRDARAETIARLGSLRVLNGSDISTTERRDAELWYLRRVTGDLARAGAERQQILASHPRVPELEEQYGAMTAAPVGAPASSQLLEVILMHGDRTLTKRLPGSLSVQRLKTLIERLLGVPAGAQGLILVQDGGFQEDISALDAHQLSDFSVLPGTRVEVTWRGPREAGGNLVDHAAGARQDLERRMVAQDEQLQALHAAQQRMFSGAARPPTG